MVSRFLRGKVSVTGSTEMDAPAERALLVLWNIGMIERYEPKLIRAEVFEEDGICGTYRTEGRFAGIPWTGRFSYEKNDQGFRSEMLEGPVGFSVKGGFVVRPMGESRCRVTHYESYRLPLWLAPLAPAIGSYLRVAMKQELQELERLVMDGEPEFSAPIDVGIAYTA